MMRLGSVILKVAPRQVADRMWYFDLLEPYVDHVPVKADLSDLEDQIRWCRKNDDKVREPLHTVLRIDSALILCFARGSTSKRFDSSYARSSSF